MFHISRTLILAAGVTLSSFFPTKAQIISDNAVIVFVADDGEHGRELWVTDGTPDRTELLADINEGPEGSGVDYLAATEDGRVFFRADDGEHGSELWVTDGTAEGTQMVRDINPGPDSSNVSNITYVGQRRVAFSASTDAGASEPWISDGTHEGTFQLVSVNPGSESAIARSFARVSDGQFMFTARRNGQRRIWVSDGTPEGTMMVPGPQRDMLDATPINPTTVVFNADHPTRGRQAWTYDLTTGDRPELLSRINRDGSSSPRSFTQLANGSLLFRARHHTRGTELFITDGTRNGTTRVRDIVRGPGSSSPSQFTPLSEERDVFLFRTSADPSVDSEPALWRTDGTGPGTQRLQGKLDATDMVMIGKELVVFSGFDRRNENTMSHGRTAWVSDGTRAGTSRITRTNRQGLSQSQNFTAIGGGLAIFTSRSANQGDEPYITDGTAEGTFRLKDINPGTESSNPNSFTALAVMPMR